MSDGLEYSEKQCHRCGKLFIVHSAKDWVFKRNIKGDKFFCSWSCLRKWEDGRGSKADRRERIIESLLAGMPVDEICKKLDVDTTNVLYWKKRVLPGEKDGQREDSESSEVYCGW